MFLRVDPQFADAGALGILVPQGAKTLVIVRPRALAWDLLPASWDGDPGHPPAFCLFTRDEAAVLARRLMQALEAAVIEGINPVQTCGDADGRRVQVWMRAADLVWVVCQRVQGKAYEPQVFASLSEAVAEGEKLAAIVWPATSVTQKYYFNTQNLV